MSDELAGWPAFARELHATLPAQSQYVLWGNAYDSFLVDDRVGDGGPLSKDGGGRLLPLPPLLCALLRHSGYTFLLDHDLMDGPDLHPIGDVDALSVARTLIGDGFRNGGKAPDLNGLYHQLAAIAVPRQPVRAAILVRAAQLFQHPADPGDAERLFLRRVEKLARAAQPVAATAGRTSSLYNPIIWLIERESDLPAWLTAGKDRIRSIALPSPDYGDRERTARLLLRPHRLPAPELAELAKAFAEQSEGLSLQGMIEITRLANDRRLSPRQLPDATRTFKLGVLDNPWQRDYLHGRIRAGEDILPRRVIGQPQAVTKTLDILKRAALGLSGAQAALASSRPRGVLFFAGPTGVGKTELAKATARLVFGDEDAYLRFDMSEFSAEHAGDRLIGAPPGYVGFEAGGELTNAVRQQPFRVILFDEIEKGHPRILDKFLQILEDGRLTDGRGGTVHFSECILIFTSNLGMYVDDGAGTMAPTVAPGAPYEQVETRVRAAIEDHFTRVLGRPELLNRFGGNIVVFDFIGPAAAIRIFDLQLANVLGRVGEEHGITVVVDDEARAMLLAECTADLSRGGRGIGAALETAFVNPLARALFERGADGGLGRGMTFTVKGWHREADVVTLDLA
jgi:ATP-dependent Clp protease ATP-binding subunit ClpB